MRAWFPVCLVVFALFAGNYGHAQAQAQARAWFDRDRIGADETATLNIETTQLAGADAVAVEPGARLVLRVRVDRKSVV